MNKRLKKQGFKEKILVYKRLQLFTTESKRFATE